jgi:sRNA-binding carbon storage regulator CsrA
MSTKLTNEDIDFISKILGLCIQYNKHIELEINRTEYFYDKENCDKIQSLEYLILNCLLNYYCGKLHRDISSGITIFNNNVKCGIESPIIIRAFKTELNQDIENFRISELNGMNFLKKRSNATNDKFT